MKKAKVVILLLIVFLSSLDGFAQDKVIDYRDLPRYFNALATNREIYNQYNDSILLLQDEDQWVSFFRRRARKNNILYASNTVILNSIFDYFKQSPEDIPHEAYVTLFECLEKQLRDNTGDPFLSLDICKILERYYKTAPDNLNLSNVLNVWMSVIEAYIANLGNDTIARRKSFEYLKRNLNEENKRYPYYIRGAILSLANLSKSGFVANKYETIEENTRYYKMLKHMVDSISLSEYFHTDEQIMIKTNLKTHNEMMARNVYMADTSATYKQVGDSIMRRTVQKNLANKKLPFSSFCRTMVMQTRIGQLTYKEALDKCLVAYQKEKKSVLHPSTRLDDASLSAFLQPYLNLIYLNDLADTSEREKRKIIKGICHDIVKAYKLREENQQKTAYIRNLISIVTYPRLTKYLSDDDRIKFVNALCAATHVTTYAHSMHVSMIAKVLMKGVIEHRPDLLVGVLGNKSIADVKHNKKHLLDFIYEASLYHDLGKNYIISVVNNDYRPITDKEFEIIKRHPELGLTFLNLSPKLAKYHDTTLGHHKWYNGKGGYPDNFDNTKSDIRILIDIVTLSDCLQAATEKVGRNYKGSKTYDTIMDEFHEKAGTVYNPELVDIIDNNEDVAQHLKPLVDEGWPYIYYQIYKQYFNK